MSTPGDVAFLKHFPGSTLIVCVQNKGDMTPSSCDVSPAHPMGLQAPPAAAASAQDAIMSPCHIFAFQLVSEQQPLRRRAVPKEESYKRVCDGRDTRYIKMELSASATARNMLTSGSGHCAHALSSHPLLPALDSSSGAAHPATSAGRVLPYDASAPAALAHRGWWMQENARCIHAEETSSDAPSGTCSVAWHVKSRARHMSRRGAAKCAQRLEAQGSAG